jgi:hypothetical protein
VFVKRAIHPPLHSRGFLALCCNPIERSRARAVTRMSACHATLWAAYEVTGMLAAASESRHGTMNIEAGQPSDEVLSPAQRLIELMLSVVATTFLLSFFAYHQVAGTGFFTARFGAFEMLCFYVPIMLSLVAPMARAVSGRRNSARPLEAFASLCTMLAALWLLHVFPFSFTHLADALPGALRFLLAWVNDGIGRFALVLQVVIGAIAALAMMLVYVVTRLHLSISSSSLGFHRRQHV